jgi:chorismate synthase
LASTFGTLFRATTFGESHGPGVGVVVDGCPPRLALAAEDIQRELDRRRPGQSRLTTQRKEADTVEILSGVYEGRTLGTPIAMLVRNEDARGRDYEEMKTKYRPSHADYTYQAKFGIRAWEGGGRASARETIGRVAAGAIAQKVLAESWGVEIIAAVAQVKDVEADFSAVRMSRAAVDETPIRCPDPTAAARMIEVVDAARKAGDSVGGVVLCVARNVPAGWGEPVFDKLDGDLARAMISLPAAKGFEIGGGFAMTRFHGTEVNDAFRRGAAGRIITRTNHSGGVQGGISNGEDIVVRVAFKPTATVLHEQDTVDVDGNETTIAARGRHDPCVLPRAVPIVEAMMALVLVDHALRQRGQCG